MRRLTPIMLFRGFRIVATSEVYQLVQCLKVEFAHYVSYFLLMVVACWMDFCEHQIDENLVVFH